MAKMRTVGIMWSIEEVSRGEHYKGWVEIANVVFGYELILTIPLSRLSPADLPENTEDVGEIRRRFRLTVRRGNTELKLDDAEYGIFLTLTFGRLLGEDPPSRAIGVTIASLHPSTCETLSSPKFGCVFND